MRVIIQNLEVSISSNNINIKDSYKVHTTSGMSSILKEIRKFAEDNKIYDTPFNHRSIKSMIREWISHNNAYVIGYKRERVGSVDLNFPQKWYVKVLYFFLSLVIL